ncbi:MAG: hypothetical protein PHN93_01820 [Sphaerochaetaceae bacterium]|nr:hypothetical protein [Sphaerochaetaceae bacterium]
MNSIELEAFVATQVSARRLAHSRSTAMQAASLVRRFSRAHDAEDAHVVGIWHDVAREWKDERLLSYCLEHGIAMEPEEAQEPMLLHGAVGAHLLAVATGSHHAEWELAIRWHTLGSQEMGPLGAALYIADYLEPLRTHLDTAQKEFILALGSMEAMCLHIVRSQQDYLRRKGKPIAATTVALGLFLGEGGNFVP